MRQQITFFPLYFQFATLIRVHNLTHYFEQDDITVFVPTTKSYNKFMSEANKFGYSLENSDIIKTFLLYHVGKHFLEFIYTFGPWNLYPVGIWCQNDVDATSSRRIDVNTTSF